MSSGVDCAVSPSGLPAAPSGLRAGAPDQPASLSGTQAAGVNTEDV